MIADLICIFNPSKFSNTSEKIGSKLYLIKNKSCLCLGGVDGLNSLCIFFLIFVISIISLNLYFINLVYYINNNNKK